jgi:hypothetical protein
MHPNNLPALIVTIGVIIAAAVLSSFSTISGFPEVEVAQPTQQDSSIVPEEGTKIDPNVENGTVYDRATVEIRDALKVVFPENTTIRRGGNPRKIQLFMAKTRSFAGHPSEIMTLNGIRKEMGCSVRKADRIMVISTYGEWDSGIEGGTRMKLVAIVPEQIQVVPRKALLPSSTLKFDWTRIPSFPDQGQTASR